MIVVNVKFTSVEVKKYSREELILKINFEDGPNKRFIEKRLDQEDTEVFAQEVINEVRKIEKDAHKPQTRGFLEDVVMVLFEDDEELVERLGHLFRRIRDDSRKLKMNRTPTNYLQNIASFQGQKYNIDY